MSTLKINTGALVVKTYFDPRVNRFVVAGDPDIETEDILASLQGQVVDTGGFVRLENISNVVEPDGLREGSTVLYDEDTQQWIVSNDINSGTY